MPGIVFVGFVLDKLAPRLFFSPSPSFSSCHYHSTTVSYSIVYHLGTGQLVC